MAHHGLHLQRLGVEKSTARQVYLLHMGELAACPTRLGLPSRRFACLLAADFAVPTGEALRAAEGRLVDAGCVCFGVWGRDCDRAHECMDELIAARECESGEALPIVTTCHGEEMLEDAVAAMLVGAAPDPLFDDDCRAVVLAVVGGPERVSAVRRSAAAVLALPAR